MFYVLFSLKYLEENVDKTYVDVGAMAKELQARWPEYGRRKAVPFRQLVEQGMRVFTSGHVDFCNVISNCFTAYKTVLHSYGLDSNPSSDNDDDDDLEVMDPHEREPRSKNQMSDMMTDLYTNKSRPPISNESDPIDISSDDEDPVEQEQAPTTSTASAASHSAQRSESNTPVDITRPPLPQLPNGNSVTITYKKMAHDKEEPVVPTAQQQTSKKRRFDEVHPSTGLTPTQSATSSTSNVSKPKKYKKEVAPKHSSLTFADVGGMDRTLKQLCELLMHIKHPEIYQHIGLPPPRGFLLHGPPGSGKTLLAHSIAGQLNIPLIEVPATELIAGVSGESEERIRDIFEQAGKSSYILK